MIKDLENLTGDFANNYKTVPVVYGESASKKAITILTIITVIPVYILIDVFDIGYMDIYFYVCLFVLLLLDIALWNAESKPQYVKIHNILKVLIVAGVFSIILIDPSVLWHGKKILLS